MVEIIKAIALLCQLNGGGYDSWQAPQVILAQQRQCQRQLVACTKARKELALVDRLYECAGQQL